MSEIISERIPLEVEGTPVCDIMIKKPYTCTENCTISDGDIMGAIAQHRAHTIFTGGEASMLYFDDQSLEQRMDGLKNRSVMEFATRKVVCARPDQSIARVAALLSKKKFKKLPVVDDKGTLVGVIRRSAITKYLFNLIFK